MSQEIELILIEDHLAVRKGLELLLRDAGFRIAGVASGVAEARPLLDRRRYDLVVLDVALVDGSGLPLIAEQLERHPDTGVVIHTGATDAEVLDAAACSGARGFVLKSAPASQLIAALRAVAGGGTWVDPGLAAMLSAGPATGRVQTLSPRELQILSLLADGLTGEQAAEQLAISSQTVRTHVRNAMWKLDARTRTHAVAMAVRERASVR